MIKKVLYKEPDDYLSPEAKKVYLDHLIAERALSLEEAIEIAKEYDPDIDNGEETYNAFIFGNSRNLSLDDSPVVVLKENGSVTNMTEYLSETSNDLKKTIREFKV